MISICNRPPVSRVQGPAAPPTMEGVKSQRMATLTVSLRTTHPTGWRGPAAATNNGTISVLLGVAVGSGKQEVALK